MFTCSICNESSIGVNQDSTSTTQCGHVFHDNCLKSWLERSPSCPYCRSIVSEDTLIKLFLQVDPNAQTKSTSGNEDELNSLKDQLKISQEERLRINYSLMLCKNEVKNALDSIEEKNQSINSLNYYIENTKRVENELTNERNLLKSEIHDLKCSDNRSKNLFFKEKEKNESMIINFHELQSLNSFVINNLRCQLADFKVEKTYYQNKKHPYIEIEDYQLPSTSKGIIEDNNITWPIIQIKSEHSGHFGHEPHLQLTRRNFLLGCVFLLVDISDYHLKKEDNIIENVKIKDKIMKYGGTIEDFYSTDVTHIICFTLDQNYVEQGIRDGKRCVTEYWLIDVLEKRSMEPPWLAHHFPLPYSKKSGFPCSNFKIHIANFDGNEYDEVSLMVSLTGAFVVQKLSSECDFIVSRKFEGEIVKLAMFDNRPIVNVQWLNDILFGAKIGIKNAWNKRYQNYDLQDPFIVDFDLVSFLMDAWKTPVNDKHTYHFNVKPSPGTSPILKKRKIQTFDNTNTGIIDLVDDDDNDVKLLGCGGGDDDDDVIITYAMPSFQQRSPIVIFCGFPKDELKKLKLIVIELKGVITTYCKEATHLVMKEPSKTMTFLRCLSTVNHIVTDGWLMDSYASKVFLDENNYSINTIFNASKRVCDVPKLLASKSRQQLFDKILFYIAPGETQFPREILEEIILSAGGTITKEPTALSKSKLYFIIANPDVPINIPTTIHPVLYTYEIVINSILTQYIQDKCDIIK